MQKTVQVDKNSLLAPLTEAQIADLIQEQNLKQDGYRFYYVLDTYDVVKYIFPFGMARTDIPDDDGYLIQENMTLVDFFDKDKADEPLFIFDEYNTEFKNLQDSVSRLTNYTDSALKTFTELSNKIIHTPNAEDTNIVSVNALYLLVSAATGNANRNVDRFQDLPKRLIIEDLNLETTDGSFLDIITTCISENKGSELTSRIFKKLKDNYTPEANKTTDEIYNFLIRKYRDCRVIDRIICINKELERRGEKTLLLYLSSTSSSLKLFPKFIEAFLPEVNKKKFNFFRNTSQLHLHFLCEKEYKDPNKKAYIDILEAAKNAAKSKVANQKTPPLFTSTTENNFNTKINEARGHIQTSGLIQVIKEIDSIRKAIANGKNSEFAEKIRALIDSATLNCILPTDRQDLAFGNLESEHKIRRDFQKSLNSISTSTTNTVFHLLRGKDAIYGRNHHLPILFYLVEESNQNQINEIVNQLLMIDLAPSNKYAFKKSIVAIANKYLDKSAISDIEVYLIRGLLLMIFPLGGAKGDISMAIENLQTGYDLSSNDNIKKEFIYALCWAYRRNKEYGKAIEFANKGIEIDKEDPRFYHGKALAQYSKYVQNKNQTLLKELTFNYEKAIICYVKLYIKTLLNLPQISSFEESVNRFTIKYKRDKETNAERYIRKNITVILYAIVLMRVHKFENDASKPYPILDDARKILNQAKKLVNSKQEEEEQQHIKYSEYSYIEAKLEYNEYLRLQNEKATPDKIKNKLDAAYKVIDTIDNSILKRSEVTALKSIIDEELFKLK